MKEIPTLFSGPMVRAIIEERKWKTRRVFKFDSVDVIERFLEPVGSSNLWDGYIGKVLCLRHPCPYGVPGDHLWVRENFRVEARELVRGKVSYMIDYAADPGTPALTETTHPDAHLFANGKPRPSIHMPRWASRLTLEVVSVRVERLQDISEEDAIAEGLLPQTGDGIGSIGAGFRWDGVGYEGNKSGYYHVPSKGGRCLCKVGGASAAQCAFQELWNSINEKRGFGWDVNPWVWVVEFKKVEK